VLLFGRLASLSICVVLCIFSHGTCLLNVVVIITCVYKTCVLNIFLLFVHCYCLTHVNFIVLCCTAFFYSCMSTVVGFVKCVCVCVCTYVCIT
jgi:hypothetical protein